MLGHPGASATRKEHTQKHALRHVKTRMNRPPGAFWNHPGAPSGLLRVSWCLRGPPARENTSPKRYFTRFQRIFRSPWVCVSVSRGLRHVKTRVPNTIPSHFNGFSRRPLYLNGIPCITASSTSAAPLHVFRRSSSSAAGDAKRPGSGTALAAQLPSQRYGCSALRMLIADPLKNRNYHR